MKRLVFFCFLSSFILLFAFHQEILTFFLNISVRAYSISKWNKPLEYQRLYLSGTRLVILEPKLENGSSFTAQQIVLDFHFDWRKRHFHIDVDIERPHWHMQTPLSSQWEKWEKVFKQEEKWIRRYRSFHINHALLTWDDPTQGHSLLFDLEANSQKGGIIKVYFDSLDTSSNCLILEALSVTRGMEVNCIVQKVNCPSLFSLVRFLGIDRPSWSMTSGTVRGKLKAIFPTIRRPYLEGELFVEGLEFLLNPLKGQIQEAHLKLEKNQIAYEINDKVPTFIGQLDISKPASLAFLSPNNEWAIQQIEGSIQLNNIETALFNLKAQTGKTDSVSQWCLQGKANLNAYRSLQVDLNLSCSSSDLNDGKIHLSFYQPQRGIKHAEIELKNVSYTECDFLQNILASYWPILKEVKFEQGELNACIQADMAEEGIGKLDIKHFQAFHLSSKINPWNAKCSFNNIRAQGKILLGKEDFWQSLNAELSLEDGQFQFEGVTPHLPVNNIQAHLLIEQGHVEHSLITLQLAGLKGTMDVEWGNHKQLLTLKLDGIVEDLAELLPNFLQEGLKKKFYHNRLMVLANIKRQNQHIELGGTLHIQRANTAQMDLIHFGCELKKIIDNHAVSRFIPTGWFNGHHLPLDTFLSPFIFRKGILSLTGEAEFKGSFDDRYVNLNYDAKNLKIENEDLSIEVKQLLATAPGQLMGSHQIDIKNCTHHGTLPIQQGTYFEKNNGLMFQDIQGMVIFNDQNIRIIPIEAYCEGVYFSGDLELDFSDPSPGVFSLMIHCPTLSGKVSQIQHLVAHLDQTSLLHKIPLEGEIVAKGEGLKLNFNFIPKNYTLHGDIQGAVTDGVLPFECAGMALKGIYMDVDYHHRNRTLEFSDIQGTLLVGKPRRVEEYLFTGNYIRIHQKETSDIEVDLSVIDHKNELLRIIGFSKDEENGTKNFYLNQNLSHIGRIYPDVWKCCLKDWSHIEQFELRSQFDLGSFLQDLKHFRQTGLLFLSHRMIDKLSQYLPIEGLGSLAICYLPDESYTFQLEGSHITQGNSLEHFGILKGRKQGKKWMIDQLKWDDLNAYAELEQTEDKWKIPFLGLHAGQALLLGLNGDFFPNEALLKAKIKFCEVNLAKLDRCEGLHSFVTKWWPKGSLKATGTLEWDCLSLNPWAGLKVSLCATLEKLAFRDYALHVLGPIQIDIQSNQIFRIQNAKLELPKKNSQGYVDIKELEYRPIQDLFSALQLTFQIPSTQLEKIGEELHHHFPDYLDAAIKDIIIGSKEQGQLKGNLTLENKNGNDHCLQFVFDDGLYRFKKRNYQLKQFELQMSREECSFSALSQEEQCPFQMIGKIKRPLCQQGELRLISSNLPSQSQPLTIKWEIHPERGWLIHEMGGEFSGCSFFLEEDKNPPSTQAPWIALQGHVIFDFNHLCPIFKPQLVEAIQKLKLDSLYSLSGHFWVNPDSGNSLLETISFKGNLSSKEAIVKGYQVQNLQADVQYVPGRLDMQNLSIQDPAGSLRASSLIFAWDSDKDLWNLFIPSLTVKNLRPSLLKDKEPSDLQPHSKFRSLIVKRIELKDFSGELNNLHTWQAQGNLHFLNPSRKNFFHPLFAIPAEIILRLGLDPHVLNPVSGIIYFNLRADRFYLTRFKDVFSEGRGSKFYLAQGVNPSWMDFDGNLSVQVRMKQYNLIFKIAELFTVSIHGHIKKPRYTLQKQTRTSHRKHSMST